MKNFYEIKVEDRVIPFSEYKNLSEEELNLAKIEWREDCKEASKALFTDLMFTELKEKLNGLGYDVVSYKGVYHRVLNKSLSSFEFESEIDAYVDCYMHSNNLN